MGKPHKPLNCHALSPLDTEKAASLQKPPLYKMETPPTAGFRPRDRPLDAYHTVGLEYAVPHFVSHTPTLYSHEHYRLHHQQQQQQQPPFYYQQHEYSFAGNSPATDDDAPAHSSQSPSAWSSQTDSSGYLSPPSDGGGNEWDLLSDMLMDDAVTAAPTDPLPPGGSGASPPSYFKQEIPPPYAQMPLLSDVMGFQQQQLSQHRMAVMANAEPQLTAYSAASAEVTYVDLVPTTQAASGRRDYGQTPALHIVTQSPVTPPTRRARAAAAVKPEPVSTDEQKKLRRRQQIACSVQRHREKKKVRVG